MRLARGVTFLTLWDVTPPKMILEFQNNSQSGGRLDPAMCHTRRWCRSTTCVLFAEAGDSHNGGQRRVVNLGNSKPLLVWP